MQTAALMAFRDVRQAMRGLEHKLFEQFHGLSLRWSAANSALNKGRMLPAQARLTECCAELHRALWLFAASLQIAVVHGAQPLAAQKRNLLLLPPSMAVKYGLFRIDQQE